jgi:hypothetical protein
MSVATPTFSIIDFNRDLSRKKKARFENINKEVSELEFVRQLDFRMDRGSRTYDGRLYVHNATMTVLAVMLSNSFFGGQKLFEFYSTLSDGTRLYTLNSKGHSQQFAPFITTQFVSRFSSLSSCFDKHRDRLYKIVTPEKKVVYDRHQKLFSLIGGVE